MGWCVGGDGSSLRGVGYCWEINAKRRITDESVDESFSNTWYVPIGDKEQSLNWRRVVPFHDIKTKPISCRSINNIKPH